ncbi:MAG: PIG-L family deacetylase [Candidatus Aenigmatarchaeota archaeon]
MKSVLIFGAHPDDVEFAMGGTLLKLVDQGFKVSLAVLTKGEAGTKGSPEIREKEVEEAAKFAGASFEFLGFKDCQIEDNYKSREKIASVIRKHKPDIVFAPYYENNAGHHDGVAHSDHFTTGNIVKHALRLAKFKNIKLDHDHHFVPHVIYYMIPRHLEPNLVCDVTDYFEKWKELANCHKSQTEGVVDRLSFYRQSVGSLIGSKYGESFIVDRPLELNLDLFK